MEIRGGGWKALQGKMRIICTVIALSVIASILGGCGSKPAATQAAQSPQASTPAMSDADAAKLVDDACAKCHPVARVNDYDGKDSWQDVVSRMVQQHGAKLAPQQAQAITTYLEKKHPVKK